MVETLKETPSQTAGPYVHIGCTPNWSGITGVIPRDLGLDVIEEGARGEQITITGRVLDGGGNAVSDCVVEIWQADASGVLRDSAGRAFEFEILLRQGASEMGAIATTYIGALEALGIRARLVQIDPAQYVERSNNYDFDMTHMLRLMSLSPGNEQLLYWGSAGVDQPGSRNLPGVNHPAVEAMIAAMLEATEREDFTAAARALDRVLMAGRYAIPLWYPAHSRLAIARNLKFPQNLPLYGDWTGFLPEVWWFEE
mgnify:CR=1 FL=1